ncbi:MAG TPA: serine/threonine-protein kinase [Ktedonobacteraceae bacterium]|jgi:WD40 repeat protein
MQDFNGKQLGNYHLHRLIGHGGFADVYLGEHIYLRTQVAIKVVSEKWEPQDMENFLKEAQTIAALKHPHILRVLDFGIEGTTLFLVMEYAPKGTLRHRHPRGSIVPFSVVMLYTKQIAMALQYAHNHKIVHRDVKPENVLVEAEDKIVLSDFGLAISAHRTQSFTTQDIAGTVLYMAPEQFRGKARPASDQYALGVLVYEWLSGACPFGGSTFIEIATQHALDRPPPLREKAPTVTAEVEQVILKALAKEPEQRFATVQEFAAALEEVYQLTLLGSTRSTSPPGRGHQKTDRGTRSDVEQTIQVPSVMKPDMEQTVPTALHHQPFGDHYPPSQPPIRRVKITQPRETLLTYHAHSKEVSAIDWSPDGTRIVSGGRDKTVQLWHAFTGKPILTYRGHSSAEGYSSTVGVSVVAWSPDGALIASGSWDKTVQVWDATNGKQVYTYLDHLASILAVAWSPDSTRIASVGRGDSTVDIWDACTGKFILTYHGHASFVYEAAWSPDGTRIASGSNDKTVQIWDASTGVQLKTYDGHSETVTAVTWSPDGTCIGSGSSDGMIQVWETSTGSQVWHHDTHSNHWWPCLRWSPDGTRIASVGRGDSTIDIWDASTGEMVQTYRGHSSLVEALAWSPDGSYIASGDHQGRVHIWQLV